MGDFDKITSDTIMYMRTTSDGAMQISVGGEFTWVDTVDTERMRLAPEGLTVEGAISAKGMFNLGTSTEITIASGALTATKSFHIVDTESDAASDDLDTINGGTIGDRLVLTSANSDRDVTVKDGTGNLKLAGDFILGAVSNTMELIFDGSHWLELSRSSNA
jgi:hypothetical protein